MPLLRRPALDFRGPADSPTTAAASQFDSPPTWREVGGYLDGNRDGNDNSHQRPDAAVDSHLLSRI
jgi:hypothetical protein